MKQCRHFDKPFAETKQMRNAWSNHAIDGMKNKVMRSSRLRRHCESSQRMASFVINSVESIGRIDLFSLGCQTGDILQNFLRNNKSCNQTAKSGVLVLTQHLNGSIVSLLAHLMRGILRRRPHESNVAVVSLLRNNNGAAVKLSQFFFVLMF
jgi:hypothetical protein